MCLKSYGLGQDPPPPLRKNSITIPFFFLWLPLYKNGVVSNMTGLVQKRTGLVLNMTGLVLNMTGFVLNEPKCFKWC